MARKSKIKDIEQLEADYRAGAPSVREVARKHGISDVYLLRLAKQRGWIRDLSVKVRERVRTKVSTPQSSGDRYTPGQEEKIVEAAAEAGAKVVKQQRKSVGDLLDSVMALREDLAQKVADGGAVESLAGPLNNLARSFAQLLPAQRMVHGLDAPSAERNQHDPLDEMSEDELRAYIKGCSS